MLKYSVMNDILSPAGARTENGLGTRHRLPLKAQGRFTAARAGP